MTAREKKPTKRDRGDGAIVRHVYRTTPKAGPNPGVPIGEWIPKGDTAIKWVRHPDGQWIRWRRTSTWYVRYSFRGKPRLESSHSTKRADAVTLLKQRREEMGLDRRGLAPFTGPDRERVTFEDLHQIAVHQTRRQPRKSAKSWRPAWKALAGFFAGMRAMRITHATLNEYVAYRLAMSRARGTIRVELATLRHAIKLAAIDGLALCPTFPSVEPSAPRKGFFEPDQYQALLAELPEAIQAVVRFLRETGWRLSEGLTLQWRQVDFPARVVRLDPGMTKNDEGRTFPFGVLPELEMLLQAQRARTSAIEASTGRLIPHIFHEDGRPIGAKRVYRAWWPAVKAAGLYREWPHPEETGKTCRGPIPHDFRRTAARDLVQAGVPERVAMDITGHKTRSVFDRYHIVSETDKTQGIEKLARFRQGQVEAPATVVSLQARRRSR
jgi:integrase